MGIQASAGGQFGQGVQLCLLWDAGEPAGLQEQLDSHGSSLPVLPTARCKPPGMQCLGFTLQASINHIVTSSSEGREGPGLLEEVMGLPNCSTPFWPWTQQTFQT